MVDMSINLTPFGNDRSIIIYNLLSQKIAQYNIFCVVGKFNVVHTLDLYEFHRVTN